MIHLAAVFGLVMVLSVVGGLGWGAVIGMSATYGKLRPERHAAEMNAVVSRISAELLAVDKAAGARTLTSAVEPSERQNGDAVSSLSDFPETAVETPIYDALREGAGAQGDMSDAEVITNAPLDGALPNRPGSRL